MFTKQYGKYDMVAGMIKLKYWSHIVRIVNIAVQITAPQMSAGLTPMVAPIVRNAIPNVALTV